MYKYKDGVITKWPSQTFWVVLSVFFGAMAIGAVLFAFWCSEASLTRAYREFSYVQLYEDGSFRGETREGKAVYGCIPGAQCND